MWSLLLYIENRARNSNYCPTSREKLELLGWTTGRRLVREEEALELRAESPEGAVLRIIHRACSVVNGSILADPEADYLEAGLWVRLYERATEHLFFHVECPSCDSVMLRKMWRPMGGHDGHIVRCEDCGEEKPVDATNWMVTSQVFRS